MITVYGIKNCDSVKKARNWLQKQGIDYQFNHFRAQGIERETLQTWIDQVGIDVIVNKRGTTWRNLEPSQQQKINEVSNAVDLLMANPTLIKRPVLNVDGIITIGFTTDSYQSLFH